MGTRNLTAVMFGGEYRVAQYGQFDGYPGGQGKTVLEFCRERLASIPSRDDFMQRIDRCRLIGEDEHLKLWESIGATDEYPTNDQVTEFRRRWPTLMREVAGKILDAIWEADAEGDDLLLKDSTSFAGDSLFCEWAYVVDLDKQTLEVFRGFNKEPLAEGERFASLPKHKLDGEYYPIKHLKTWSLDELPLAETFVEELQKLAYPEDENEAAE